MVEYIDAIALLAALLFANLFFIARLFGYFTARPIIKAGMAISLAIMCFTTKNPIYLFASGLLLSALGDWFLDLRDKKWFLAGLIAFLLAHIAYILFLLPNMQSLSDFGLTNWGVIFGIIVITAGFFIWLKPALPKQYILPVLFYSIIIAIMGIAAFNTRLPSNLIPIGAGLFILSDMVLAVDKFKHEFAYGKALNWALYAGGQILLALGVVLSVS